MPLNRVFSVYVLSAAMAVAFSACDKKSGAGTDHIAAGDQRAKLGEYAAAIRSYESALDGTAKSAEVHFKLAIIYDQKREQPLNAIHHYDRYLELASSNATHIADAKSGRTKCERDLQMKLNREGYMPVSEATRLRNENELYRRRLEEEGIKIYSKKTSPEDLKAREKLPPGSRKHTVKSGDTLASIAMKYYGSRGLAGHLRDANQVLLGGKDNIFPGQVLIVPDAPR